MDSYKKIDNYYVWGIKGIIFLMPFIPLYVTPSIVFPYITGKNFAFRIMVEFAAALWLGLISTNKEYRLRSSPITLSILLFTFIVGFADLFGVNPYKSFWSNYERMEGYITILHLALYFMILRSVIRTRKEWMILLNIFVAISFLVSIVALSAPLPAPKSSQFSIEYGHRVYGTIGNPPFLASYLLLSFFACLIVIINTQNPYIKFVYLFPIIVNSVAIYFSASRGVILAAFIGAITLSLFYIFGRSGGSRARIIKKAVLSVVCILIVLSVAFFALRHTNLIKHDRTISRFVNILSDTSVRTRFSAWELAWEGFKERPVLGWGQENFIGVYTTAPVPLTEEGQIWVDRAHNIIMDWLVSAGILGLFSYAAIFGTAFYVLWGAYQERGVSKNEAFIIATGLGVYFIQNLFIFDTINTYLFFFTLLAYIGRFDCPKSAADLSSEIIIPRKVMLKSVSAGLLALLVFSGMVYFINYRPIRESQLFMRISKTDSFALLLDDFNRALSLQTFGDSLVRQGMRDVSFKIIKRELFMRDGAPKFIEATVEELEKELAANPYNLENLTDTIFSYMQIAKYEPSFHARTETLIRTCMQLNPEYEWPSMVLADLYLLKKDYKYAYDNIRKIVDRDPDNDMKQLKLALVAILVSRDDVASGALENIAKMRRPNNVLPYNKKSYLSVDELCKLAQAYNDAKKFQKALEYYQEAINYIQPAVDAGHLLVRAKLKREAKIRFEMALVYFTVGDKATASKEAQRAAELDPEHFAGVTEQIKSLNN